MLPTVPYKVEGVKKRDLQSPNHAAPRASPATGCATHLLTTHTIRDTTTVYRDNGLHPHHGGAHGSNNDSRCC